MMGQAKFIQEDWCVNLNDMGCLCPGPVDARRKTPYGNSTCVKCGYRVMVKTPAWPEVRYELHHAPDDSYVMYAMSRADNTSFNARISFRDFDVSLYYGSELRYWYELEASLRDQLKKSVEKYWWSKNALMPQMPVYATKEDLEKAGLGNLLLQEQKAKEEWSKQRLDYKVVGVNGDRVPIYKGDPVLQAIPADGSLAFAEKLNQMQDKANQSSKMLEKAFTFLCSLQMGDFPVATQRQHLELVRELKKYLKPEPEKPALQVKATINDKPVGISKVDYQLKSKFAEGDIRKPFFPKKYEGHFCTGDKCAICNK